jgi:hypothetical protein
MIKTIKLALSHGRLSDREPFIVADNETLSLTFESDYKLSELLISLINGETVKQYKSSGNSFTVPSDLCKAGTLEIVVKLMKSGEVVKTWNVAPIIVKEINEGFEAYDVIYALEERIIALEEKAHSHNVIK